MNTSADRALFLTLFYRERLLRYTETLATINWAKKTKQKKAAYASFDQSLLQIADFITRTVNRAEDTTRCNDICKNMYFCDLKKGHKGKHKEEVGLVW